MNDTKSELAERYDNIDCLRTLSCFGIIAMHIKANTNYEIGGILYNKVIPSWTMLVFLFLMISSFGMCCGYFKRFKEQTIDIEKFYQRRYSKILPFFAFVIGIEVIMTRTLESVYEAIIELTLTFGLLPNNKLSVIGVGWTLGVIFVFYFMFPFFVYILSSKQRAWFSLIISFIITYLCEIYFFSEKFVVNNFLNRQSFLYCVPFFMAGGLIYLYRETIVANITKYRIPFFICCCFATVLYYVIPSGYDLFRIPLWKELILYTIWLCYIISVESKIFNNRFMHFFGNISLEMYLAHMVIFRGLQKLKLDRIISIGWIQYLFTVFLVITFLTAFIIVVNKISQTLLNKISSNKPTIKMN